MRFCLLLFSFALLLWSCNQQSKLNAEAEALTIEVDVERFDVQFAKTSPEDFSALKAKHAFLFPDHIPDSLWIEKMQSELQHEINTEVLKSFPDFETESRSIERFFKYVKHYFPRYKLPKVYTLAEEVNYRQRLVWDDEALLVSLDNYLGKDHKFYKGLPDYIAFQQDKDFMISNIAEEFIRQNLKSKQSRTFLSDMIYYGKILYMKDVLIPFEPDTHKIYYSEDQLQWAVDNERKIWSFFVERDLIYSTDQRLEDRFIRIAPYSKFYLELDNDSSPRIGRFIGWQIVRRYMKKFPNTSLKELLELKADIIFKKSNYKP